MGPNNTGEERLARMLAAYRNACPDVEGGPGFMPGLWERIDSRRSYTFRIARVAQGFVTAAAAICMLFVIILSEPFSGTSLFYTSTYIDELDEQQEIVALAEIVRGDAPAEADLR